MKMKYVLLSGSLVILLTCCRSTRRAEAHQVPLKIGYFNLNTVKVSTGYGDWKSRTNDTFQHTVESFKNEETIRKAVEEVAKEDSLDLVVDESGIYSGSQFVTNYGIDVTEQIVSKTKSSFKPKQETTDSLN